MGHFDTGRPSAPRGPPRTRGRPPRNLRDGAGQGVHWSAVMTFAEMLLLIVGGTGLYLLLKPLQRWIERRLIRTLPARPPHVRQPTIDVTDFTSHDTRRKDNDLE
jgi:hypothetical protein